MPSLANVFQAVLRSLLSSPLSNEKMEQVEREETAGQVWNEIIVREIVHKENID